MFDKSTRSKQVCQLLLSLIVGLLYLPIPLLAETWKIFTINAVSIFST